jgi:hypothetical protein
MGVWACTLYAWYIDDDNVLISSLIATLTGYYAIGPDFTLVAISQHLIVHIIAHANLRRRRDRIMNIRRLINIAGLFQTLADLVRPVDAEFEQLDMLFSLFFRASQTLISLSTAETMVLSRSQVIILSKNTLARIGFNV